MANQFVADNDREPPGRTDSSNNLIDPVLNSNPGVNQHIVNAIEIFVDTNVLINARRNCAKLDQNGYFNVDHVKQFIKDSVGKNEDWLWSMDLKDIEIRVPAEILAELTGGNRRWRYFEAQLNEKERVVRTLKDHELRYSTDRKLILHVKRRQLEFGNGPHRVLLATADRLCSQLAIVSGVSVVRFLPKLAVFIPGSNCRFGSSPFSLAYNKDATIMLSHLNELLDQVEKWKGTHMVVDVEILRILDFLLHENSGDTLKHARVIERARKICYIIDRYALGGTLRAGGLVAC